MSAAAFPMRRDDVLVVEIGTEAVLYDPVAPAVHHLNATALLVWKCCDRTADASTISADLADTFSEPPAATLAVVNDVIDDFFDHGLLVGSSQPAQPGADEVIQIDRPVPIEHARETRRLGPYAAVDLHFAVVCFDSEAIADELERVLDSLRVHPTEQGGSPTVPITVWSDHEGHHLDAAGLQLTTADDSMLVDCAVQQVTRLAIERSKRYLVLHASTVARNGQAVMMPARSNSGKSTLATIMVEAGFDYLTDEASFVDLETGDVVAFPKPIMLDPGSQQLLAHLAPPGLTGQSTKWRIAPGAVRPGAVAEQAKLAHIVLPMHDIEADNTLVECSTVDGVVALLAAAVNVTDHASHLDRLVALVDSCTVHALRHDGIDGPRAAIESLFDTGT